MSIDRRTFLETPMWGAGLALSPSFNYLLGSPQPSDYPHRFIFVRKSNGNVPALFSLPTLSTREKEKDDNKEAFETDLNNHELPIWLRELEEHKDNLTILHGISMTVSGGGHYSFSGCMGAYKAGRNVISGIKRTTVDFELAKLVPSPFSHVELSLTGDYSNFRTGIVPGYSAPAKHQRNYCYADPQTAYNELFKSVTNPLAVGSDSSLLDYLYEQEARRLDGLDGRERMKISNHVDSIQSIQERNKKVATLSDAISKNLPRMDKIHAGGGPNASLLDKQHAFSDVLVAALISGLTNVVTFTIDELSTPITTLAGNTSRVDLHRLGHSKNTKLRDIVKASHMVQIAKIVTRLKSVPEGAGTMFDNTTIIYMPETGAGHHGPDTEAPMVIMTGKNSKIDIAGRYIRLPFHSTEGHKTLSNWYTTLLNAYGNPIEHYGDKDLEMSRKKMHQTGAIAQFLA
ncbi:MAG: DUF1552 domain-containing protein [Planctomycetaceae bacterium]|nr:DUF1552 domain-containing protein [Planctomycetaceae bacterium]